MGAGTGFDQNGGGSGGGVTGGGTPGTIPKFNTSSSVVDSIITEDTNSVGINSTNVTAGLEVKEKSAATGQTILSVADFSGNNQFQVSENDIVALSNGGLFNNYGLEVYGYNVTALNLSGSTSNLNIGRIGNLVELTATGAQDLTGMITGPLNIEGTAIYLHNLDTVDTITLKHNTTSTASNRFNFTTSADISLPAGNTILLMYVGGRWRNVRGV